MTKLDLTKPYRTREGEAAGAIEGPDGRLYGWCQDQDNDGTGALLSQDWDQDGSITNGRKPHPWDLVNVGEGLEP